MRAACVCLRAGVWPSSRPSSSTPHRPSRGGCLCMHAVSEPRAGVPQRSQHSIITCPSARPLHDPPPPGTTPHHTAPSYHTLHAPLFSATPSYTRPHNHACHQPDTQSQPPAEATDTRIPITLPPAWYCHSQCQSCPYPKGSSKHRTQITQPSTRLGSMMLGAQGQGWCLTPRTARTLVHAT